MRPTFVLESIARRRKKYDAICEFVPRSRKSYLNHPT